MHLLDCLNFLGDDLFGRCACWQCSLECDRSAEPGIACTNGIPQILIGYWAYLDDPSPADGKRRLRAVIWYVLLLPCLCFARRACSICAIASVHAALLGSQPVFPVRELMVGLDLHASPENLCFGGQGSAANVTCAVNRLPAEHNPLCGKCAPNHSYSL